MNEIKRMIQEITRDPKELMDQLRNHYEDVINDIEEYYKARIREMEHRHWQ